MYQDSDPLVEKFYSEASSLSHVIEKTPPFLLIYGTADDMRPIEQSIHIQQLLERHRFTNCLIEVEGARHGLEIPGAINLPDLLGEIAAWFHTHLGFIGDE